MYMQILKPRFLFILLGVLLLISLASLYYRYMVLNNYEIYLADQEEEENI